MMSGQQVLVRLACEAEQISYKKPPNNTFVSARVLARRVLEWMSEQQVGSVGSALFDRLAYQPLASSTFVTNQPQEINRQYFYLRTNKHQTPRAKRTGCVGFWHFATYGSQLTRHALSF
jgi:hypothetical protein